MPAGEITKKFKDEFDSDIKLIRSLKDLESLEIQYLGRKSGKLNEILRGLKGKTENERKIVGQKANALKSYILNGISKKRQTFDFGESVAAFDSSIPGIPVREGHLHLVTEAISEIEKIFERIGFYRRRYPEVEWDYYAFESLNMPKGHPARDEWETFFIKGDDGGFFERKGIRGKLVLTPHTSSGQVREMERQKPPIRMMNIAKCYRRQIDVSHVPMFHQFEGLLVDENISIAHLIGVLKYFIKEFFGPERKMRLRPFHFQFTEPSFEVDVSCSVCLGSGCRLCKSGWLELGGAGMVHPNVLKAGKIDPKKYSGFAFGWGVERTSMMKEGLQLPDIRILYQNDLRFLEQF